VSIERAPFGPLAIVSGAVWIALGIVRLADPTYWSPESRLDYAAVGLFSAALLTLGLCLIRVNVSLSGLTRRAGQAAGFGAIVVSLANLIEDGFHVAAFGLLFIAGTLSVSVALLVLGIALVRPSASRWLGALVLLTLVGLFLSSRGGFFVIGALWLAAGAVAPLRLRILGAAPATP
jgi:hypothetical protein